MKNSIRFMLMIGCVTVAGLLFAQDSSLPAPRVPQNARQALLDMFFGKPGSLERHLPEATRKAIREAGAGGPSLLQQFSMVSSQLNTPENRIQTFETGSTLLSVEQPNILTKFEAIVEKDDLRGDEDDIELSFRMFKNGQPEKSPVLPALTCVMKQEKNVWRLSEISVTIRVALADPELLKTLVTDAQGATGIAVVTPGSGVARADELSAIASMRTIVTAETAYAVTYGNTGYTCSLSDLDGFGQGTPNEHQAMLIESRLASGKKRGYIFSLTGCGSTPSTHFQLTAVPADNAMGRAFCVDESAVVRASADGQAATCVARGTALE